MYNRQQQTVTSQEFQKRYFLLNGFLIVAKRSNYEMDSIPKLPNRVSGQWSRN